MRFDKQAPLTEALKTFLCNSHDLVGSVLHLQVISVVAIQSLLFCKLPNSVLFSTFTSVIPFRQIVHASRVDIHLDVQYSNRKAIYVPLGAGSSCADYGWMYFLYPFLLPTTGFHPKKISPKCSTYDMDEFTNIDDDDHIAFQSRCRHDFVPQMSIADEGIETLEIS